MRHFPIFLNMDSARVVLSGGGAAALAKLRLLMKTPARLEVFATHPAPELEGWHRAGRIVLRRRALSADDMAGAVLAYAADEDPARDAEIAALALAAGILCNIVDNLADSAFITPAMVDRAPLTVAIGTEGAAPMLARAVKADLEQRLPAVTGALTRAAQAFRPEAEELPPGRARRDFWAEWFDTAGPEAMAAGGDAALLPALRTLRARHLAGARAPGRLDLTWTGSSDPDLMTLKARKALDRADVVVHDAAVSTAVLELARREADFVELSGDTDVPPLPRLLTGHAARGAHVLYIASGPIPQPLLAACRASGLTVATIPGIAADPEAPSEILKETA